MDLLDLMNRTAFLGAEFLTWLWYCSEKDDAVFDGGQEIGPFELWFDDKLAISAPAVNAQENLFKGGHPTSSLEARTALRLGKLATESKLRIVRAGQEWTFSLKAAGLIVSGVKPPAVLSREDDDRFYERMLLVEQLDQMIKALLAQFLRVRIADEWASEELPKIRRWVAGATA